MPSHLTLAARLSYMMDADPVDALSKCLDWKSPSGKYTCPFCTDGGYVLTAKTGGLICSNKLCSWGFGSVMDLIAALYGCSFDRAVRWVVYRLPVGEQTNQEINAAGAWFEAKRSIIELLGTRAFEATTDTLSQFSVSSWAASIGVDPILNARSFRVLKFKDIIRLNNIVESVSDLPPLKLPDWENEDHVAVMLHMASYGSVGHIVVALPGASGGTPIILRIEDTAPLHYFGLLDMHPDCISPSIAFNYVTTNRVNEHYNTYAKDRYCLTATHTGVVGGDTAFIPSECRIILNPKLDAEAAPLTSALITKVAAVTIIPELDGEMRLGKEVTWGVFVRQFAFNELQDGGGALSGTLLDFLSLAVTDGKVKKEMLKEWRRREYFVAAGQWEEMDDGRLVFSDKDVSVHSSCAGFFVVNKGRSTRFPVTNFTAEPVETLQVQDGAYNYKMLVQFRGQEFEVFVPADKLFSVPDLERVVRNQTDIVLGEIPTIMDRKYASHIQDYLRWRLSSLPVRVGIDTLGWNTRKDRYQTVWGVYDKNREGWAEAEILTATENPWMRMYTASTVSGDVSIDQCSPAFKELLCVCCGMIATRFKGHDTRGCGVKLSEGTLTKFFSSVFGQKEAVNVGRLNREKIRQTSFSGYPVHVEPVDFEVVEDLIWAVGGVGGDEVVSEEGSRKVIGKLVEYCCQDAAALRKIALRRSVQRITTIKELGRTLLELLAPDVTWPAIASGYPTLDAWMEALPIKDVKHFVEHRPMDSVLILTPVGVELPFMIMELTRLVAGKKVELSADKRSISIPAYEGIEMLESFYGFAPEMAITT